MNGRAKAVNIRAPITPDVIELDPERWLEPMIEVYLAAYQKQPKYSWHRRRDIKRYIRWLARRPGARLIGIISGSRLLGWMALEPAFVNESGQQVAALHEIVVHPDAQHRGFGALLLQYALDWFSQLPAPQLELWVGVHNREAQQFYEKFGFRACNETQGIWRKMVYARPRCARRARQPHPANGEEGTN